MNKTASLVETVRTNMNSVAELGNWPTYINVERSMLGRIPTDETPAPGFDAGLACALELIPKDKQRLAAGLHAAYTPELVAQVREESKELTPDSETTWWLAACSICDEGGVNQEQFLAQIESFTNLANDPVLRLEAASNCLKEKMTLFSLVDDTVFVTQDGGIQGAYIAGHNWGVQYAPMYGIFFIATFHPTLGLEDFKWGDKKDSEDRPMSGPVHGSRQFVKAATFEELTEALKIVRQTFA